MSVCVATNDADATPRTRGHPDSLDGGPVAPAVPDRTRAHNATPSAHPGRGSEIKKIAKSATWGGNLCPNFLQKAGNPKRGEQSIMAPSGNGQYGCGSYGKRSDAAGQCAMPQEIVDGITNGYKNIN